MNCYMIQNKDSWIVSSCRLTRQECVYFWTGIWKSENCKEWRFAKSKGVKIVRVKVELDQR